MKWPRASGILVHPTSFPGRFGVGDLGPGAIRMLDFLHYSGQKIWQVLPLGPTGYGNSPYSLLSAFAGNPLLISPERLVEEGLLNAAALADAPNLPADHVDFGAALPWKDSTLRASHTRFTTTASGEMRAAYDTFCAEQASWLEDFALFMALKSEHDGRAWVQWPSRHANRQPKALSDARARLADEIAFHRYSQFLFARQWAALRHEAQARGIRILGDLAIFVAHDSADVWAHPELFQLDSHGQPLVVAGVPPDYFSETGQRWGNPIYRWDTLATTGYAWWVARVRQALELEDYIRLDHFRGFEGYWEIPGASETAVDGRWTPGPGAALFDAIHAACGEVPFIAEDLGVITDEVRALRRQLGFPGMRVMQFGYDDGPRSRHLPHHFTRDSIVYTGTHDNDTTAGWFAACNAQQRSFTLRYLQTEPHDVPLAMLRAALASVARMVITPLQDALGLGTQARMNYPSRPDGNWEWRCDDTLLTPALAERLAEMTALYDR